MNEQRRRYYRYTKDSFDENSFFILLHIVPIVFIYIFYYNLIIQMVFSISCTCHAAFGFLALFMLSAMNLLRSLFKSCFFDSGVLILDIFLGVRLIISGRSVNPKKGINTYLFTHSIIRKTHTGLF